MICVINLLLGSHTNLGLVHAVPGFLGYLLSLSFVPVVELYRNEYSTLQKPKCSSSRTQMTIKMI